MSSPPTTFTTSAARAEDADRIAEIHLAAMDTNPLLHAQFPTPLSRAALRRFLAEKYYSVDASADDRHPDRNRAGLLVARCNPSSPASHSEPAPPGQIASFIKWECNRPSEITEEGEEKTKLEAGELQDTEGCRREFLDAYAMLAEEAQKRAFGDRACYCLTFVCTDPAFQGLGVASLLTREVLRRAAADSLPVYLESTPAATRMYERLGFEALDRFAMTVPRPGEPGATEEYAEVCMVWYPPLASAQEYVVRPNT